MSDVAAVYAALGGAVVGAALFALIRLELMVQRVNRNVVWSENATLRGKLAVYRTHIAERENPRYTVRIIGRGTLIGCVVGFVGYVFVVGLAEVLVG